MDCQIEPLSIPADDISAAGCLAVACLFLSFSSSISGDLCHPFSGLPSGVRAFLDPTQHYSGSSMNNGFKILGKHECFHGVMFRGKPLCTVMHAVRAFSGSG